MACDGVKAQRGNSTAGDCADGSAPCGRNTVALMTRKSRLRPRYMAGVGEACGHRRDGARLGPSLGTGHRSPPQSEDGTVDRRGVVSGAPE